MRHGAYQINVNGEHVLAVSDKQLQIVGQGIRESTNFFFGTLSFPAETQQFVLRAPSVAH